MKLKVQNTDLNLDGKYYNEGSIHEFDEKKKEVKDLMERGILVKAEAEAKAEIKQEKK